MATVLLHTLVLGWMFAGFFLFVSGIYAEVKGFHRGKTTEGLDLIFGAAMLLTLAVALANGIV